MQASIKEKKSERKTFIVFLVNVAIKKNVPMKVQRQRIIQRLREIEVTKPSEHEKN